MTDASLQRIAAKEILEEVDLVSSQFTQTGVDALKRSKSLKSFRVKAGSLEVSFPK